MENVEKVEKEVGVHVEATGIPPIDLVLAQHIMSFLKGLDGPGMITRAQAYTSPPVANTVPITGEVGGHDASFGLCWVF